MRYLPALASLLLACSPPSQQPAPAPPALSATASSDLESTSLAEEEAGDLAVDRQNLNEQLTAYVESYGQAWSYAHKFSGLVLVAHRGEIIYERGFGHADWDRKTPNTADTSYRIGSLTKQFTAAAILELQEQGKLSVRDPISKHIPGYPAGGANITIHQLLTHTSGIPSYTDFPELMESRQQGRTVEQMLQLFWDKPLDFEPGDRFSYSNSGYVVLGAIIERASGQSYGDFVRAQLFEPAGLENTVYGDAQGAKDRALAYKIKDDELVAAHPIDMSIPYAAGGIRSTARDMVKWHQALAGSKILSAASKNQMYQPDKQSYAYGWSIRDTSGHPVIEHGGGIDGFVTAYMRVMDADLVVVVWSNNEMGKSQTIAEKALIAAFGGKIEPVDEGKPGKLDPAIASRLPGTYRLDAASIKRLKDLQAPNGLIESVKEIKVTVSGNSLEIAPKGMPPLSLSSLGGANFLDKTNGIHVEVVLGKDGRKVEKMQFRQNQVELDYVPAK